ncbi:MAG: DUF4040 domain-containing protein, partial [Bacteroidales bacterium]|nr:DUF4040 domain-containing protein [Bacteroidales bacterium]
VMAIGQITGAKLALWHGFNLILLFSLITLAGGIGIYFLTNSVKKQMPLFNRIAKFGPEAGYNLFLKGLVTISSKQTKFFQNGSLRSYFYYILSFFIGIIFLTILKYQLSTWIRFDLNDIYFYEVLIVAIMVLAIFLSIISKSVLGAVAALGIVGFGIALFFALLSAPDLALTQFSIETLTVILLVLVVYKIPKIKSLSSKRIITRDAVLSVLAGVTVTSLVLIVLNNPADSKISGYFLENSYVLAHGRNIVNVILVDFRALDTMGEITVLALAAIGVYTLLKFRYNSSEQ